MITFADLLRASSQALYGKVSPPDLARDLGVNERSVRRWLAGTVPASAPAIVGKLAQVARGRRNGLVALIERLERWGR